MAEKTQATASGAEIDAAGARDLYRRMRLIRTFEDTVQSQFQKGNVHGTTHLYSGQEASGVGVCSMLRDGDKVAGTYRGHGHSIALGVDPQKLMDEMLGRATGACGGRAGSMNVVDAEAGLIGCFGIVGGSIGAATTRPGWSSSPPRHRSGMKSPMPTCSCSPGWASTTWSGSARRAGSRPGTRRWWPPSSGPPPCS